MADRILAVVAHPDDETLGCGGTLARHIKSGDAVSVFVLADGVGSRMGPRQGGINTSGLAEAIKQRHGMFRRATEILGTNDVWLYQFTDNAMDAVPLIQVVQHIERHIKRFQPTIVYTHWRGDLNVDHRAVHDAVNVACRPQPGCSVRRVLYFEVPCSTAWGEPFNPNYFVDITSTLDIKMQALECYAEELRPAPHPRSTVGVNALAMMRGFKVGLNAAEGFIVGRMVE